MGTGEAVQDEAAMERDHPGGEGEAEE